MLKTTSKAHSDATAMEIRNIKRLIKKLFENQEDQDWVLKGIFCNESNNKILSFTMLSQLSKALFIRENINKNKTLLLENAETLKELNEEGFLSQKNQEPNICITRTFKNESLVYLVTLLAAQGIKQLKIKENMQVFSSVEQTMVFF